MDTFDPPGLFRTAADEAFLLVKSIAKKTHEDVIALGKALIAARDVCPHGQWEARCRKAGVAPSTARWTIAKAESQIANVSDLDLFDEASENPADDTTTTAPGQRTTGKRKSTKAKTEENGNEEDREAGDDTDSERAAEEAENPYLKPLARHAEGLVKIAQEVVKRDIDTKEVNWINQTLSAVLVRLRAAVMAPIRAEAPRPGKCKDCGRDVLWVKTTKGKNMPVDAEPSHAGTFDIRGGVAHHVKYEAGRDWKLYRSHFQSCPERKKKC